jgi:ApaG protein
MDTQPGFPYNRYFPIGIFMCLNRHSCFFSVKNSHNLLKNDKFLLTYTSLTIGNMVSKISEGVKVTVETYYQPDYSNPVNSEFMFAYRITILNNNTFPVKLLSRHWFIFDSNGSLRETEGEGVVGIQPMINPGEQYQYVSGCNLRTEIGKMYGTYTMENITNKHNFEVVIPPFEMNAPFKLN